MNNLYDGLVLFISFWALLLAIVMIAGALKILVPNWCRDFKIKVTNFLDKY